MTRVPIHVCANPTCSNVGTGPLPCADEPGHAQRVAMSNPYAEFKRIDRELRRIDRELTMVNRTLLAVGVLAIVTAVLSWW